MLVEHCLVQEIDADNDQMIGISNSILYTFIDPTWVSPHKRSKGGRLGHSPVTILNNEISPDTTADPKKFVFSPRPLPSTWGSTIEISLSEDWVVPPWTLYVLVLPEAFIAKVISFKARDNSGADDELKMGVSYEQRLFFYYLFQGAESNHVFEIKALLERNPEALKNKRNDIEVVKETSKSARLFRATATENNIERVLRAIPFLQKLISEIK